MTPRHKYTPKTAEGIECKSNCHAMYDSCRTQVLDECEASLGSKCSESSLMASDEINACRADEAQCLKVCEKSENS